MTGVLKRRGNLDTHMHKGLHRNSQGEDSHVKMEAEIGVMLPQAMENLELPEAGRNKEKSYRKGF